MPARVPRGLGGTLKALGRRGAEGGEHPAAVQLRRGHASNTSLAPVGYRRKVAWPCDSSGGVRRRLCSGSILNVEPTRFFNALEWGVIENKSKGKLQGFEPKKEGLIHRREFLVENSNLDFIKQVAWRMGT